MKLRSFPSRPDRWWTGAVPCAFGLLALAALTTPLFSGPPGPDTKTQPVYLAYTVNNIGYLFTCG